MDEDRRKALKDNWWRDRVQQSGIFQFGYEESERWLLKRCEGYAKERGMTLEQYIDFEFSRHCWMNLVENQDARGEHALKLIQRGHEREGLYMLEVLLAEGYCTKEFPLDLAKTYRKLKRLDDEIRVLERGIYLFEHLHEDWHPLDQHRPWSELNANLLRERLEKAKGWKTKTK